MFHYCMKNGQGGIRPDSVHFLTSCPSPSIWGEAQFSARSKGTGGFCRDKSSVPDPHPREPLLTRWGLQACDAEDIGQEVLPVPDTFSSSILIARASADVLIRKKKFRDKKQIGISHK